MSKISDPVLREIAQMGKDKEIGNPDRMFFAYELCLIEFEKGHLVSRALHNLNVVFSRLYATNCCHNTISTKFYRVFRYIESFRVAEVACGAFPVSVIILGSAVLSVYITTGYVTVCSVAFPATLLYPVFKYGKMLEFIALDLYMARKYFSKNEEDRESFMKYVNVGFEDA
jgi:hypothetical protein